MSRVICKTEARNALETGFFFALMLLMVLLCVVGMVLCGWELLHQETNADSKALLIIIAVQLFCAVYLFRFGFNRFNLRQVVVYEDKVVFYHRMTGDRVLLRSAIQSLSYEYNARKKRFNLSFELTEPPTKVSLEDISEEDCVAIVKNLQAGVPQQ